MPSRFVKLREEFLSALECSECDDFVVVPDLEFVNWAAIFHKYFLAPDFGTFAKDDLLFFVRRTSHDNDDYLDDKDRAVDVFRIGSRLVPSIDYPQPYNWKHTVFMNFVLHELDFIATLAICYKRDDAEGFEAIRRSSQHVSACPTSYDPQERGSDHKMTYPTVHFIVGQMEQESGLLLEPGQTACVELVGCTEGKEGETFSIFLGSIRHEVLADALESKKTARRSNLWKRLSRQRSEGSNQTEFIKMKGPQGKGLAEVGLTYATKRESSLHDSNESIASAASDSLCRAAKRPDGGRTSLKDGASFQQDRSSPSRLSWLASTVLQRSAQKPLCVRLTSISLSCGSIVQDVMVNRNAPTL